MGLNIFKKKKSADSKNQDAPSVGSEELANELDNLPPIDEDPSSDTAVESASDGKTSGASGNDSASENTSSARDAAGSGGDIDSAFGDYASSSDSSSETALESVSSEPSPSSASDDSASDSAISWAQDPDPSDDVSGETTQEAGSTGHPSQDGSLQDASQERASKPQQNDSGNLSADAPSDKRSAGQSGAAQMTSSTDASSSSSSPSASSQHASSKSVSNDTAARDDTDGSKAQTTDASPVAAGSDSTASDPDLPGFDDEYADVRSVKKELSTPVVAEREGSEIKDVFIEKHTYQELLSILDSSKKTLQLEVNSQKNIFDTNEKMSGHFEAVNSSFASLYSSLSSIVDILFQDDD